MVKILLIEDEAPIRDEVNDWLQFEGYSVVAAANGRIGLEMLYQENPDLIVCDIAMPELSGHDVLVEIRSNIHYCHIPFIFMTAAADRESVRKGMDMGADDYLTKPFTHSEVLRAVQAQLEKKAKHDAQFQQQLSYLHQALSAEQQQRLLKSRLVAMFSHDFRNPLASILSSTELIHKYEDRLDTERRHKYLNRINGAVYRLMQMLEDMLMMAEIENGHLEFNPQPLALASFVESILEEMQLIDLNQHQFAYQCAITESVLADPKLLRQILTNMLANAIKYSPAGSTITTCVTQTENAMSIRIEDQGIGIPPESLPHLFEPFHRATNAKTFKGTGLGLSIVKECVTQHNGSIEVESELDKGTRFTVLLPLLQPIGV